ncbi:SpoIIE family protein phosphatase [Bacillus sp. WMMC1349]|uniref:PP2C family serine/threonine-protein phosphatase n=1 Tax=Bacillus sp. WMMC1349 TaxID=2736254 RepID=UPI001557CEF8|nr:PP2C family serine/threonine-protein phosphatase [Bacillus sp. WMMC1349]NPC90773.1 SpoIIE family protein phosphatase [Bacillus sp. WMMC1349]NPC91613.1 SpoIIE family protein phosphatase [Bacillus sp. WMMC1349]
MIWTEANRYIRALVYQIPKEGKRICGDSFYFHTTNNGMICSVADGLGSGDLAHESSSTISQMIEKYRDDDIQNLMERCNQAMKHKRGATVAILKADFKTKTLTYTSVGNIRFILYHPSDQFFSPIPTKGYLSGKPHTTKKTFTYSYQQGSKFMIYSDGLSVPALRHELKHHSPETISQKLEMYTTHGNDDLTYIIGQFC